MKALRAESDSWGAFQLRYISYRKKLTWNNWLHVPDDAGHFRTSSVEHIREKARRATDRLNLAIRRLRSNANFPKRPSEFGQKDMNRIIEQQLLPVRLRGTLWETLIFTRDKYTCRYCYRSVAGVWRESNKSRTIGLVLDHCNPRARGGDNYSFANCLTSCWSCNGIKSTLPTEVFRLELESLARAILAPRRAAKS
jgi:5-methylcytosine-specific restriction endonuclease McrA